MSCSSCQRPLEDEYTEFFDRHYHPKCFNCASCGLNLMRKAFKAIGDIPYCNKCVENTPQLYQKWKKQKVDNSGRVYAQKGKPPSKQPARAAKSGGGGAGAAGGGAVQTVTTTSTQKSVTNTPAPAGASSTTPTKDDGKKKEEEEPIENKKVTKTTMVFCCTVM